MPQRNGTQRACDPCSIRKVRCDGSQPCLRCAKNSWSCTYLKTPGKSGPKGPRKSTAVMIRELQTQSHDKGVYLHKRVSADNGSPSTVGLNRESRLRPDGQQRPQTLSEEFHWMRTVIFTDSVFEDQPQNFPGISISLISPYLDIYQSRGYAIWPVVDTESLLARLVTHQDDMEAYALATSLCAATITQFQIDENKSLIAGYSPVSSKVFGVEAKRARLTYDYQERMTTWSLLSSFFLHVYAANVGRMSASTFLLSEAITVAHIIGLHKKSYYDVLDHDQQQYNLRIYWLLFITERAHSIQNDVPVILKRSSDLPALDLRVDRSIPLAFIRLCYLFNILDETIKVNSTNPSLRRALKLAQRQLNQNLVSGSVEKDEIQRADVSMTQQWMRIFLWQYSLSVTHLHSAAEDDEFSFSFPAKVAKSVLGYMSNLSRRSLEAHGPGMETKLFDIANSLADVMICVPSINHGGYLAIGPRDLIHSLSSLLASFRGGNSAILSILQDKLTTLGLSVSSPPRIVELSSDEDDEWNLDRNRLPQDKL
ncbi:hypothetical protein AOQ84DRAFT_288809 [Glonium stellatum]|uniref:Zn(2)-C6 fungal-type domain-containing protein n=1 Tax=Glonium stellatum TaxID=574774 RepID=A0A8E2F5D8_9PEZI|nr:hypothetical protein AOQ84DRAFT_288809 [Glonium stellatum]